MNDVTMSGLLFDGGPSMLSLEDESSLWFVREELRELYLVSVGLMTRRRTSEVEASVKSGLAGNRSITSSWLLGLRSEARAAAGLDPIALDRMGNYRVTEGWPVELMASEAIVAWALHQSAAAEAVSELDSRSFAEALQLSTGGACCLVCSVAVNGVSSKLCGLCERVLAVVEFERARVLGRDRLGGRLTRFEAVERWVGQG